jgi:hypothetical protein
MDLHPPEGDTGLGYPASTVTPAGQRVLDYIEETFDNILGEVKTRPCGKPVIILRRIVSVRPYYDEVDPGILKWHIQDREVKYFYPGKTKDEAWRFGRRRV